MASEWGATGLGALSGAGTGAMIGSALPGPGTAIGAGLGGLVGGLTGFFGAHGANGAAAAQRQALDKAMKQLAAYSQQSYQRRMNDLQTTLGYYKPADNLLHSMYAQPQQPAGPPPGVGHWMAPPQRTNPGMP